MSPRRSKRRRVASGETDDGEGDPSVELQLPSPANATPPNELEDSAPRDEEEEEDEEAARAADEATGWNPQDDPSFPTDPVTHSFSYWSEVPESTTDEDVTLGVDEAGRGPVLGPMVYSIAYIPTSKAEELKGIGFADSKTLTDPERVDLFAELRRNPSWIGWACTVCTPRDISNSMLRKSKYNLNALAHDTTINLIKGTLERGVRVKEVYIDTVGPPDVYQQKLAKIFPGVKITVSKKADSLYPIVSAASICAKVPRDRILSRWSFAERGLDGITSRKFGSGYPGDPNTVSWLQRHMDRVFGYPVLLRFSWSTCDRLLEEKAATVTWPDYDEDASAPPITAFFKPGAAQEKKLQRPAYFTQMKLKRVEKLF